MRGNSFLLRTLLKLLFILVTYANIAAETTLYIDQIPVHKTSRRRTPLEVSCDSVWKRFDYPGHYGDMQTALVTVIVVNTREPRILSGLTLQWQDEEGRPTDTPATTNASLYFKEKTNDEMVPLQRSYVSSGRWNPKDKTFFFPIPDRKIVSKNPFFVVLGYPRAIDDSIIKCRLVYSEQYPLKTDTIYTK